MIVNTAPHTRGVGVGDTIPFTLLKQFQAHVVSVDNEWNVAPLTPEYTDGDKVYLPP